MNKIKIGLKADKLLLVMAFNPKIIDTLKLKIPFNLRNYDAINKIWAISFVNNQSIDYFYAFLESIKNTAVIEIDPAAKSFLITKHHDYKTNIELSQSLKSKIQDSDLRLKLPIREFQKTAIEYAALHKHIFIADPVGVGKTIEALATLQYLKSYPVLVIAPAIALSQWTKEIDKWIGNISYSILHPSVKAYNLSAGIIITTYDIAKKYLIELQSIKFKALILDESHLIKDKKTQRFKSIFQLAKDKDIMLLLSATPLANKPIDLIAQLEVLGMFDKLFKSWHYFVERYCNAKKTRFGYDVSGSSHIEELKNILRANCMIVRDKKEIMPELPDKTRQTIAMTLSDKYRKLYNDTLDDISNWYHEKERRLLIENILNLTPEQKAKVEQKVMAAKDKGRSLQSEALVRLNALRSISGIGKTESVKEWIDIYLENKEKLVVFIDHRDVMARLLQYYPSSAFIDGTLSPANRGLQIQRFWNDKDCYLMIASIRASGIAIDLQNASNALFVEMWWTATAHIQAEGRLERHGQKNAMNMYYAIADEFGDKSIDNQMFDVITEKMKVANTFKSKTGVGDILHILKNIVKK